MYKKLNTNSIKVEYSEFGDWFFFDGNYYELSNFSQEDSEGYFWEPVFQMEAIKFVSEDEIDFFDVYADRKAYMADEGYYLGE